MFYIECAQLGSAGDLILAGRGARDMEKRYTPGSFMIHEHTGRSKNQYKGELIRSHLGNWALIPSGTFSGMYRLPLLQFNS